MTRSVAILIAVLILMLPMTTLGAASNDLTQNTINAAQNAQTMGETGIWSDNFSLTLSLKLWNSNFTFDALKDTSIDDENENYEATSTMFGPAFNLTIRDRFYTGFSYYTGSGFELTNDYGTKINATKKDFDIWGGWSFHPRGSVFIGYKFTDLNFEFEDSYYEYEESITFQGPVIGVSGNLPIKQSGFVLFGTLGYAFASKLSWEYSSGEKDEYDASGPAIEFGCAYIFSRLPRLSLTLGYKHQTYQVEAEDEDVDDIDVTSFSGFTFGANYRF